MAGFAGKGPVVVASCYWAKCDEMRAAVSARGHGQCVCFYPGDDVEFGFQFGANIEKWAAVAGRVILITGDAGEIGNMQSKEISYMTSKGITFEQMTLAKYKSLFAYDGRLEEDYLVYPGADTVSDMACLPHIQDGSAEPGRCMAECKHRGLAGFVFNSASGNAYFKSENIFEKGLKDAAPLVVTYIRKRVGDYHVHWGKDTASNLALMPLMDVGSATLAKCTQECESRGADGFVFDAATGTAWFKSAHILAEGLKDSAPTMVTYIKANSED
mmetsp:Transcript_18679/g.58665  ORF Transcript_18679/g.58665 Transcript_18679/m.58665 type:complete len:272 (+) Transcript_18679:106-921(+)|eukprot:CAMPEP_0204581224 /NCGR_PEP_ID=MMETSP0661-20131031/44519_1 /ASSEMBLY_ACC=CAM_ASM_000606 /TAXON_ID=109239 /ORGANISM="Alexandrium margalefi, Strain AMGDE01CS-322" /LENGTH=271 /DNA_ID=CAMNT_0051590387 /DNA_START=105 /DNA_END=920 /DNA_ORIENTATION=-